MRRTIIGMMVIGCQLMIVGFFFGTVFNNDVRVEKHVSTVHNDNLNKIAKSVSLLFENEEETLPVSKTIDEMVLEELPSIEKLDEEVKKIDNNENNQENEVQSTPLSSVEASKYSSNEPMGFVVTEGNRTYSLNDYEFNVVVAVVSGEFDKNSDDALAVVSVILNRCDSDTWRQWAGDTPYKQVIRAGQFEIYFSGDYMKYMPGGAQYGTEKYNIARQAVLDGLNGIRNNNYLGFRAWWISSYSDKYIVVGGNRYGFN